MYYDIDETTARNAHNCVHMSDYKTGSATAEYQEAVDAAAEIAEKQKTKVSAFYHEKIDSLLDSYCRRLASWTNDYNRNAAKYPSQFICGAGNYNMRKHNAQMERERTLWAEYDEIKMIPEKIKSVGTGPVDLADPNARAMLEERRNKYQSRLDLYKKLNAYMRKHNTFIGCPDITETDAVVYQSEWEKAKESCPWIDKPFPAYELTSIRNKVKRIDERIEELNRREIAAEQPTEAEEYEGYQIVRNVEIDRLQILFDSIPDEETRTALKRNGFRWSPKNKAWQRQLTDNAERAAKAILNI